MGLQLQNYDKSTCTPYYIIYMYFHRSLYMYWWALTMFNFTLKEWSIVRSKVLITKNSYQLKVRIYKDEIGVLIQKVCTSACTCYSPRATWHVFLSWLYAGFLISLSAKIFSKALLTNISASFLLLIAQP